MYEEFYDKQYSRDQYARTLKMEQHAFYKVLRGYISKYDEKYFGKEKVKCLEIGSGRGALQDIVEDYTGVDYASTVEPYYHKKFVNDSATKLPFKDGTFDLIWSYAVLEHIPDLELALEEMLRVVCGGGHLILSPAWHCRPWAAEGYQVRPYSDFKLKGKIYKFFIPVLDSLPLRALGQLPPRIAAWIKLKFRKRPLKLQYKKLRANYERFWQSDSDACNALDPLLMIYWFESRGYNCVSHTTFLSRLLIRHGEIDIQC